MNTVAKSVGDIPDKIHCERNYGIDFLRIVSMLMVVVLHVLGQGGILRNAVPLSANYNVVWLMETASYCAVNCYALISGYVGYKAKFKVSSILNIWLQVIFYTVGIGLITAPLLESVDRTYVISAFFPVINNIYWYFTAYFCICFFTPLFNKIINDFSQKHLKLLALALIGMFSVIPTIAQKDLFHTNSGYSALWLAVLYILGGITAKCGLLNKLKSLTLFFIYVVCVVFSWAVKIVIQAKLPSLNEFRSILISYTSPTVVIASLALLVMFSRMKIGKKSKMAVKLISLISPLTLGVYLIHVNSVVWVNFMRDRFVKYVDFGTVKLVAAVIITVLAIFFICVAIDFVRDRIFKLLKIKKLLLKAEFAIREKLKI